MSVSVEKLVLQNAVNFLPQPKSIMGQSVDFIVTKRIHKNWEIEGKGVKG